MYKIEYSETAISEIVLLKKNSPSAYKKLVSLISELQEHPFSGTGHPEQLKHVPGVWSRRIDKKNRLRYTVINKIVTVYVISAMGHYGDK